MNNADRPFVVPVFAVPGVLLLPGGHLPLTVFEPRYLALVDDALGEGRLLAVIQPAPETIAPGPAPGLYTVGTLGRIVAFGEMDDGRYLITLLGLRRFQVVSEAEERSGYRRVMVDYTPFAKDEASPVPELIDRQRLTGAVSAYLSRQGMLMDEMALRNASDAEVVTILAMTAPLSSGEKQAILEVPSIGERARLMVTIFEMALLGREHDALH